MDRLKVLLTAAVTYITIIQAVLVIFSEELASLFADGDAQTVVATIVKVIAVLGAVVTIIRRVTPVLPSERGLLPAQRQF